MADDALVPRAPSGTHDVLWPESYRWEALLAAFADQVERAGYGLAHTPIFEDVRVFRRGTGEGSDVVGKEMYEFEDRGGRALALRPEGTAPIVRAFVQHRPPLPWKAWYATPAFRYERPQAGRYRQHHQLGVEVLGPEDPDLDVEVVGLADGFYRAVGLVSFGLRLNSMGDSVCRPDYLDLLRGYLAERRDELCPEHRDRLDVNPLARRPPL
jgi:histidyl-tRNA synthetase